MSWAEPDLGCAADAMQWVYSHREEARTQAEEDAAALETIYSLARIGEIAKARLMQLLQANLKE
jgi:hypothetical protein